MIQLLVWSLACWGLTSILTRGRIFQYPRARLRPGTFLGDLVRCDQCTGLWVGLGLSVWPGLGIARWVQYVPTFLDWTSGSPVVRELATHPLPAVVLAVVDGLCSSALCAVAGALTDWVKAAAVSAALGKGPSAVASGGEAAESRGSRPAPPAGVRRE
jgi:hypothetical protein